MEMKLAENIRQFRKEHHMTQDQLAEVMGVTLGAVSKWEQGRSVPDLDLIVSLADFFGTSVDVLLGYEKHADSVRLALKEIRRLRNEKSFDEASALAEKALSRYPNSFEIVYACAVLYQMIGIERHSGPADDRALALLDRAIELIDQNRDPHVNLWTLRNRIAAVYENQGRHEQALECLRANNAGGLNDASIGLILARELKDKGQESLPSLSSALVHNISQMNDICVAYSNVYENAGRPKEGLGILRWLLSCLEPLKLSGKVSYLDKMEAELWTACAILSGEAGRQEEALGYLERAQECADRFDREPTYSYNNVRYISEFAGTAFDDFGSTAREGVRKLLERQGKSSDFLLKNMK